MGWTSGRRSRQGHAVAREHGRKGVAGEEGMFPLSQRRQGIEALQLGVDEAGMTHDHAAVGQPLEEAREQRREICRVVEFIGAGEGRIGAQPQRRGTAAESEIGRASCRERV